ncbi:hypothetical protein U3516DRAFT_901612 [Neocallimastix sp. 'constans']|jgi:hypothetical protein
MSQKPSSDIAVIDRTKIFRHSTEYILERKKRPFSKYNLKVKRFNGIKHYKGICEKDKHVIGTLDEKPIFCIKDSFKEGTRKDIYLSKNNELIGSIKCCPSIRKYIIEYTNLITESKEYLVMKSDRRVVVCGIYQGIGPNAPLIAHIIEINVNPANVLFIFLQGLILYL